MTNDPQRVKKLARNFAAEWVRPSDPDHASPVLLDTLETMMLAFFACASQLKPEVADVTRDGLIRRIEADGAVVEFMPDHEGVRIVQPSAAPALDVEIEFIIGRMRHDRARFRDAPGGSDVVSATTVDDWADDLEEVVARLRAQLEKVNHD